MVKWGRMIIGVFGVLVIAGGVWAGGVFADTGAKTARMTARFICPCVYADGLPLEYCMSSMPVSDAVKAQLSVFADEQEQSLEATAFGFFRASATRVDGASCVLKR